MSKPPRTSHSKSRKEPVTIDLDAKDVERAKADPSRPAGTPGETDLDKGAAADTSRQASATSGEKPDDSSRKAGAPSAASQAKPEQKSSAKPAAASSPATASTASSSAPGETKKPEGAAGATSAPKPASDQQGATPGKGTGASPPPGGSPPGGRPSAVAAGPGRGSGRGSAMVAGAVGGLVVLLLVFALQWAGLLPGTAPQTDDAAIAELRSEISELRSALEAIEPPPDAAEIDARVSGALDTELAALREEVSGLEERVAAAGETEVSLEPVEARLDELEAAIAALGDAAAPQADLGEVEGEIATLSERVDALEAATDPADELAERLDALEAELATLSGRMDERADEPRAAMVMAVTALRSAIDGGSSFESELETVAALGADDEIVEGLRAHASAGVATNRELAAEVGDAADAMVAAARARGEADGFWSGLWESARDLVSVRPVGPVEGDSPEAVVARIEAAVLAGDHERAIAEYEMLDPAAQLAGRDFMERLRARHEADTLAARALSEALRAA